MSNNVDDGVNPVTTIPATISEYTGNIEFTYVALNTWRNAGYNMDLDKDTEYQKLLIPETILIKIM